MNRDDIIRLTRKAGFTDGMVSIVGAEGFANFAALVAEHEREQCAKVCDLVAREIDDTNGNATYCAAAIRARGQE